MYMPCIFLSENEVKSSFTLILTLILSSKILQSLYLKVYLAYSNKVIQTFLLCIYAIPSFLKATHIYSRVKSCLKWACFSTALLPCFNCTTPT